MCDEENASTCVKLMLCCCKIGFVAIYALLLQIGLSRFTRFCVENFFYKKLCVWRKNDKYQVCHYDEDGKRAVKCILVITILIIILIIILKIILITFLEIILITFLIIILSIINIISIIMPPILEHASSALHHMWEGRHHKSPSRNRP